MRAFAPHPRLVERGEAALDISGGFIVDDRTTGEAWRARGNLFRCAGESAGRRPEVPLCIDIDPDLGPDGYAVDVADSGIIVHGGDNAGTLYGVQTLLRLIRAADRRAIPAVRIEDAPRMLVRGLCLDLGRRYWSIATLYALIDDMAWRGLNRLQLQLTEWNGFRVRLSDPTLAALASDESYSSDDLNDLITHAHARSIRVTAGINLPAHATALIQSRPELRFGEDMLDNGAQWVGWETDGWMVDFLDEDNRAFLYALVGAFVNEVHADAHHFGGDEWFSEEQLAVSPALVAEADRLERTLASPATPADVVTLFMNELAAPHLEAGRCIELWSWPGFFHGEARTVTLDRRFAVTAWDESPSDIAAIVEAGHRVIASPEKTHYVTPRTAPGNLAGVNYVATSGEELLHANVPDVGGEQLCVWADWAEEQADDYFCWYLEQALPVFAERAWGDYARRSPIEIADAYALTRIEDLGGVNIVGGARITVPSCGVVRAVRLLPELPDEVKTDRGHWLPHVQGVLDQCRGTRVLARDEDGLWSTVLDVQRLLGDTPQWIDLVGVAGAVELRVESKAAALQVQWLLADRSAEALSPHSQEKELDHV